MVQERNREPWDRMKAALELGAEDLDYIWVDGTGIDYQGAVFPLGFGFASPQKL